MNTNANIVATFQDRYGDDRHIHATRNGLTVKRRGDTPCQVLSKVISGYFGERVRAIRQSKEMSAAELCLRAGLGGTGKQRVYEIEKNKRSIGVRLGTVYQIAMALDVEMSDLLPTAGMVRQLAKVSNVISTRLTVQ